MVSAILRARSTRELEQLVSQETAMATDWDAVTAEELPGVVDSYVWK